MPNRKTLPDPSAARRIAIGFASGFFIAFAPWIGLGLWFGKQSPWPSWSLLLIAGSLAVSLLCFLYAFSGLIFFRCPNCKTRIRRHTFVTRLGLVRDRHAGGEHPFGKNVRQAPRAGGFALVGDEEMERRKRISQNDPR